VVVLSYPGPSKPGVHCVGKLRETSGVAVPLNCESDEADRVVGVGEG